MAFLGSYPGVYCSLNRPKRATVDDGYHYSVPIHIINVFDTFLYFPSSSSSTWSIVVMALIRFDIRNDHHYGEDYGDYRPCNLSSLPTDIGSTRCMVIDIIIIRSLTLSLSLSLSVSGSILTLVSASWWHTCCHN